MCPYRFKYLNWTYFFFFLRFLMWTIFSSFYWICCNIASVFIFCFFGFMRHVGSYLSNQESNLHTLTTELPGQRGPWQNILLNAFLKAGGYLLLKFQFSEVKFQNKEVNLPYLWLWSKVCKVPRGSYSDLDFPWDGLHQMPSSHWRQFFGFGFSVGWPFLNDFIKAPIDFVWMSKYHVVLNSLL